MRKKLTTKKSATKRRARRKGAIVVLTAVLMVPLMCIVALVVDHGYLLKKRADLQRAADAAALAAVRDLLPDDDGNQDLTTVRNTVRQYAASNVEDVSNFTVPDADIEIGRYDPATIYTNFTILNTGIFDTVRVTLRRDTTTNARVPLFFARIFGITDAEINVTATAVLPKARYVTPGVGILPFSIPKAEWDATSLGGAWSIYGDGKLLDDNGATVPGNWGTVDIGSTSNSTADLTDQMLNGLRQEDLDALYADSRIPQDTYIDSTAPLFANGDTGISAGMKSAVRAVHGETKLIPVYDTVSGSGGSVEFHITGWAVSKVVDSSWNGANLTYVKIKKSYLYDGFLSATTDLSDTTNVIEGAFAAPVLAE